MSIAAMHGKELHRQQAQGLPQESTTRTGDWEVAWQCLQMPEADLGKLPKLSVRMMDALAGPIKAHRSELDWLKLCSFCIPSGCVR